MRKRVKLRVQFTLHGTKREVEHLKNVLHIIKSAFDAGISLSNSIALAQHVADNVMTVKDYKTPDHYMTLKK